MTDISAKACHGGPALLWRVRAITTMSCMGCGLKRCVLCILIAQSIVLAEFDRVEMRKAFVAGNADRGDFLISITRH